MRNPESDSRAHVGAEGAAGRRRLPPDERRAAILAAALPCFARGGYAGTGTRDLARASGVTEPILYRHFPGKAGLFEAVLERVGDRLVAAVEQAAGDGEGADERLRALARELPGIIEGCRDELRVLNAATLVEDEPRIHAAASACARRVGGALGATFRGRGLRKGVRAETTGFMLLEIGMGAAMLRPLAVPEMERPDFAERAVQLLLRGLAG